MKIINIYYMKILKLNELLSVDKGWINVKVDNHIKDRVFKYIDKLNSKITNKVDQYDLKKKLEILISMKDTFNKKSKLDDVITYMMILQYFKEIKDNFDGSPAGFLIEELLASLVGGNRVEGNKSTDIIAKKFMIKGDETLKLQNVSYQVKLYTKGNQIKFNPDNLCDITIICIKEGKFIENDKGKFLANYSGKDGKIYICFLNKDELLKYKTSPGGSISTVSLSTDITVPKVVIDFDDINHAMGTITKGIREN